MSGVAVELTGFTWPSEYHEACHKLVDIIKPHADYALLSFTHRQLPLLVVDTESNKANEAVPHLQIVLPTLGAFVTNWKLLLREISAAFEGCIVAIQVDGVTEAAIGGKILGQEPEN